MDTKATDVDLTLSPENNFCKNFADGSRVFKPMAGTRRSNNDLGLSGIKIDNKVKIRRRSIETTRRLVTRIL